MTEQRRQLWLAYRDSLTVSYIIAACTSPAFYFGAHIDLGRTVLVGLLSGFVFGTCFFLLGTVRPRIQIGSFGANVLAQTGLMTGTVVVASSLVGWLAAAIFTNRNPFDLQLLNQVAGVVTPAMLLIYLPAGIVLAGIVNGLFAIDRKLGPGVMWSWITGKYYRPREEGRIFMFLDMRDSTTIAEKLGNIEFSALIKDFFLDMTYPVLETRGEVSHYIGDEAVLTWTLEQGLRNANCLQLFFKMEHALELRAEYYTKRYGFVPSFKAGAHVGKVVATEVGEIKSEIVYHGDVLNTAARIQGLCSELGSFLISGELASKLEMPASLALSPLGPQVLKGKENEVEIFAVELKR